MFQLFQWAEFKVTTWFMSTATGQITHHYVAKIFRVSKCYSVMKKNSHLALPELMSTTWSKSFFYSNMLCLYEFQSLIILFLTFFPKNVARCSWIIIKCSRWNSFLFSSFIQLKYEREKTCQRMCLLFWRGTKSTFLYLVLRLPERKLEQ